ncbi:hypothetical protein M8818_004818 [Zalaria obscura]|uniref:Uncharacterized protein n=1 Tax=Zalaria obscura TaxID=2024903 RepID=A0ACC3SCG9_9PEZI
MPVTVEYPKEEASLHVPARARLRPAAATGGGERRAQPRSQPCRPTAAKMDHSPRGGTLRRCGTQRKLGRSCTHVNNSSLQEHVNVLSGPL